MATLHRINLAAGWLRDGDRHARRFHWPRPLPPGESLVLVLTVSAPAIITLNGVPLGSDSGEFALTPLELRNELVVVTAGEVTQARLEVRDSTPPPAGGTSRESP